MSSYLPFQNESDQDYHSKEEEESISDDKNKQRFHIGSYCYNERKSFSVITNIQFDECVIINLSKKQRKTVKLASLQLITNSKDLKKAQRLHQKYKGNLQNIKMETKHHKSINSVENMSKAVELTGKQQRDATLSMYK